MVPIVFMGFLSQLITGGPHIVVIMMIHGHFNFCSTWKGENKRSFNSLCNVNEEWNVNRDDNHENDQRSENDYHYTNE